MFVWVATNLEHVQNAKTAISVNSPTDPDVLEVVDRYDETTTGYCAARVHDTDLYGLTETVGFTKKLIVDGESVGNIAVGGAPTVLCTVELSLYRYVAWVIRNTGANQIDAYSALCWTSIITYSVQTNMGALAAGNSAGAQSGSAAGSAWLPANFAPAGWRWLRVQAVSAAGTTARVDVIGMR